MVYLSLSRATVGARNITRGRLGDNLRLRTQFGRHFVLHGNKTLASGHSWSEALDNLLMREVTEYIQRENLAVPPETPFTELSKLWLEDFDALAARYPRNVTVQQPKPPGAPVKPAQPANI